MTNDMNTPKAKIISRNLVIARTHLRDMSYNRLARRTLIKGLYISPLELLTIESGEREVTVDELYVLASALMVSVDFLLADREEQALIEQQRHTDAKLSVERLQELRCIKH